jgi:hypothetical protein
MEHRDIIKGHHAPTEECIVCRLRKQIADLKAELSAEQTVNGNKEAIINGLKKEVQALRAICVKYIAPSKLGKANDEVVRLKEKTDG